MRSWLRRPVMLSVASVILVGCGTTLQPTFAPAHPDPDLPGVSTDETLVPRTASTPSGPFIREVCRSRGTPTGWIVVAYRQGSEACPGVPEGEDGNTMKVIERYSHRPVGSTMVVCADQPLPRDWERRANPDTADRCPGARVGQDLPTSVLIRRVR